MNTWIHLANVVTGSQTFGYSSIRSLVNEGSDMGLRFKIKTNIK